MRGYLYIQYNGSTSKRTKKVTGALRQKRKRKTRAGLFAADNQYYMLVCRLHPRSLGASKYARWIGIHEGYNGPKAIVTVRIFNLLIKGWHWSQI